MSGCSDALSDLLGDIGPGLMLAAGVAVFALYSAITMMGGGSRRRSSRPNRRRFGLFRTGRNRALEEVFEDEEYPSLNDMIGDILVQGEIHS